MEHQGRLCDSRGQRSQYGGAEVKVRAVRISAGDQRQRRQHLCVGYDGPVIVWGKVRVCGI